MRKLLLLFLLLKSFGSLLSFCVLDSKKGWWLDCGVRDSYLFRIKDLGGIQANFDFGFGFGDEDGFPNSISKSNQKAKGPYPLKPSGYQGGHAPYHRRRISKPTAQNRRNDFPYRYETPPSLSLNPPRTRQTPSQIRRVYQPQSQFRSQTPSPPLPFRPKPQQFTKPHYQPPLPQPSKTSTSSYRVPIPRSSQTLKRTRWSPPLSQEPRRQSSWKGPPTNVPKLPAMPLQVQNQHQQPQTFSSSQTPHHRQDSQRKVWRGGPHPELKKQNRFLWPNTTPKKPSRQKPVVPTPQKRVDLTWWPPSNPTSQFIPPPPLPPSHIPPSHLPPPPIPPRPLPPNPTFHRQDTGFGSSSGFQRPFVFHLPTTTTPPPQTVGPAMSELLNVPAHMSANSDNVPSFAAKMFIVRESPPEFYPPNYDQDADPRRRNIHVEIPRTKFYCEDQKYLPGIYADSMLGCKMFHLCVPSAIGSSLASYLCPNGTLFDQSILQCNYWYNVDCESSVKDYDANLALALSYRRINAAHLPLQAATNVNNLALLSQNMNHLQVPNPKKKSTFSRRMGRAMEVEDIADPKNVSEHYSRDSRTFWTEDDNHPPNLLEKRTGSNRTFSKTKKKSLLSNVSRNFSGNNLVSNASSSDPLNANSLRGVTVSDDYNLLLKELIIQIQTEFRGRAKSNQELMTSSYSYYSNDNLPINSENVLNSTAKHSSTVEKNVHHRRSSEHG